MPVTEALCTPFGFLYGGSGIAACAVAAEAATGRPLVWITTQYVRNAKPGDIVELAVDVVVHARATSQTHVHGTVDGRTVLHATTAHTDRPDGDARWWGEMPAVSPPEAGAPFVLPWEHVTSGSFVERMERFLVPEMPELVAEGRAAMWVRVPGWPIGSPASQGFVADIIPMAIGMAIGQGPGGTSLDNTVRIVHRRTHRRLDPARHRVRGHQPLDRLRTGPPVAARRHVDRRRDAERDHPHQPPPDLRAGTAEVAADSRRPGARPGVPAQPGSWTARR